MRFRQRFLGIILASVLVIFYQNCAPTSSGNSSQNVTGAPDQTSMLSSLSPGVGGNGHGYVGLTAPATARPGTRFYARANAGSAPFQFLVKSGPARVISINAETAEIEVFAQAQENESIVLEVQDASGASATAAVLVDTIASALRTLDNSMGPVAYISRSHLYEGKVVAGWPSHYKFFLLRQIDALERKLRYAANADSASASIEREIQTLQSGYYETDDRITGGVIALYDRDPIKGLSLSSKVSANLLESEINKAKIFNYPIYLLDFGRNFEFDQTTGTIAAVVNFAENSTGDFNFGRQMIVVFKFNESGFELLDVLVDSRMVSQNLSGPGIDGMAALQQHDRIAIAGEMIILASSRPNAKDQVLVFKKSGARWQAVQGFSVGNAQSFIADLKWKNEKLYVLSGNDYFSGIKPSSVQLEVFALDSINRLSLRTKLQLANDNKYNFVKMELVDNQVFLVNEEMISGALTSFLYKYEWQSNQLVRKSRESLGSYLNCLSFKVLAVDRLVLGCPGSLEIGEFSKTSGQVILFAQAKDQWKVQQTILPDAEIGFGAYLSNWNGFLAVSSSLSSNIKIYKFTSP